MSISMITIRTLWYFAFRKEFIRGTETWHLHAWSFAFTSIELDICRISEKNNMSLQNFCLDAEKLDIKKMQYKKSDGEKSISLTIFDISEASDIWEKNLSLLKVIKWHFLFEYYQKLLENIQNILYVCFLFLRVWIVHESKLQKLLHNFKSLKAACTAYTFLRTVSSYFKWHLFYPAVSKIVGERGLGEWKRVLVQSHEGENSYCLAATGITS